MYVPQLIVLVSSPVFLSIFWHRRQTRRQHLQIDPVRPSLQVSTGRQSTNNVIKRTRARKQSRNELRLVLWVVCLQLLCWLPVTMVAIWLAGRRLPYMGNIYEITELFPGLLLLADPVVYLVFLKDVRKEVAAQVGLAFRAVQSVASHVATSQPHDR
ncbi:hypothetical protein BV898_13316 [Hypsibius exemplaris]|uniref:G-protein coupled receptors family 1 profile domain-containing protein n=1 Tax=Hypsibius exemplaris TaxID=2072580 RepID=A0A1W0WB88_HYPEX|nr:hypothetical protein BV898_13316 [Hypsibius exemplaris]